MLEQEEINATAIETHAFQYRATKLLESLSWWQKSIITTIVGGICFYFYSTFQWPTDKEEIKDIRKSVEKLAEISISEAMKNAVQYKEITGKVEDIDKSMERYEKTQLEQGKLLLKILTETKGLKISPGYSNSN